MRIALATHQKGMPYVGQADKQDSGSIAKEEPSFLSQSPLPPSQS